MYDGVSESHHLTRHLEDQPVQPQVAQNADETRLLGRSRWQRDFNGHTRLVDQSGPFAES